MRLNGEIVLSGDKSMSHRVTTLAALAEGNSLIENVARCLDCAMTEEAFCELGVLRTYEANDSLKLEPRPWQAGNYGIYCGNSGTTMRLLMGVIAGMPGINAELLGDKSLAKRPMDRVAWPLTTMGAVITTENGRPPVKIDGIALRGAKIWSQVASAQVKSAVLFAGLLASGTTKYIEAVPTRDHTERLFKYLKLPIGISDSPEGRVIEVHGPARPKSFSLRLPGDISNAAVLTAMAMSLPGSRINLPKVLYNPLRNGFFDNMRQMGANISILYQDSTPEFTCDIDVSYTESLTDFFISPRTMVTMIDEIPIFAVTAVLHGARGVIRGIGELRVKESDRARALLDLLKALSVSARVENDDLIIKDARIMKPGKLNYNGFDHRIAFAYLLAGMALDIPVKIEHRSILHVSYADFDDDLEELTS